MIWELYLRKGIYRAHRNKRNVGLSLFCFVFPFWTPVDMLLMGQVMSFLGLVSVFTGVMLASRDFIVACIGVYLFSLYYHWHRPKIISRSLQKRRWKLIARSSSWSKQKALKEWQSSEDIDGEVKLSILAYFPSIPSFYDDEVTVHSERHGQSVDSKNRSTNDNPNKGSWERSDK